METPQHTKRRRRGTLVTGGFAHFIHDGFTDTLFVLLPLWATGFGLSHAQVGFLKMCMHGSLASFQVPAGLAAERLGERLVLALGTALVGAGYLLLTLADGFTGLAALLLIAGAGCAVQHPLASSVISTAFEGAGRRAALGTYNFAGDLGKVAVPFTVAAVAGAYGWRTGSLFAGALGLVAAVAVYLLLRHFAAGARPVRAVHHPDGGDKPAPLGWGIDNRRGFSVLVGISIIDSAARTGVLTFLPFLLMDKGLDVTGVGFALALIFAGGAAGKLVCGLVAERLGILRTVVITEMATGGLILAAISAELTTAMALLPFLGVALNGTSSVLYGTVGDFVRADRQARAFGVFYSLGTGASALSPLLYGIASDAWGLSFALSALAASVFLTLPLCLALRPELKPA